MNTLTPLLFCVLACTIFLFGREYQQHSNIMAIANCAVGQTAKQKSVGLAAVGVLFENGKPIGYACVSQEMAVVRK